MQAKPPYLVTHSGLFHADDVFATAILWLAFGRTTTIRTRDKQVITQAQEDGAIVYDVGLDYSTDKATYDHHQLGGAGLRDTGCPYAAVGLIWKHYGRLALEQIPEVPTGYETEMVFESIDKSHIQGIDALDNGDVTQISKLTSNGATINIESISKIISDLNQITSLETLSQDQCFIEAVELAEKIIKRAALNATDKLIGIKRLEQWYKNIEVKGILMMEHYVPWYEFAAIRTNILYVIFPSDGTWLCQCAPKNVTQQFTSRKLLPTQWHGMNGDELVQITGINDATFAHKDGFICGALTKEGCINLAKLAIAQ